MTDKNCACTGNDCTWQLLIEAHMQDLGDLSAVQSHPVGDWRNLHPKVAGAMLSSTAHFLTALADLMQELTDRVCAGEIALAEAIEQAKEKVAAAQKQLET